MGVRLLRHAARFYPAVGAGHGIDAFAECCSSGGSPARLLAGLAVLAALAPGSPAGGGARGHDPVSARGRGDHGDRLDLRLRPGGRGRGGRRLAVQGAPVAVHRAAVDRVRPARARLVHVRRGRREREPERRARRTVWVPRSPLEAPSAARSAIGRRRSSPRTARALPGRHPARVGRRCTGHADPGPPRRQPGRAHARSARRRQPGPARVRFRGSSRDVVDGRSATAARRRWSGSPVTSS